MRKKYIFTSESVTEGHPDKICDQISDAILDAILIQDPEARVACETMITQGQAIISGEITTVADIEYERIVKETISIHLQRQDRFLGEMKELGIYDEEIDT